MTREFAGACARAFAQSVGLGWRPGGTPSIHTRQSPAEGIWPEGIPVLSPCAPAVVVARARALPARMAKRSVNIDPSFGCATRNARRWCGCFGERHVQRAQAS